MIYDALSHWLFRLKNSANCCKEFIVPLLIYVVYLMFVLIEKLGFFNKQL